MPTYIYTEQDLEVNNVELSDLPDQWNCPFSKEIAEFVYTNLLWLLQ